LILKGKVKKKTQNKDGLLPGMTIYGRGLFTNTMENVNIDVVTSTQKNSKLYLTCLYEYI
jgi:hypothetical protein